jgi:hypothetical protein
MSSALITSYFSKKVHPNNPQDSWVAGRGADGRVIQNSIDYIKPWYNSVKSLGLNGFVFHDNLSDEFIYEYETENIKFIKVHPSEYSNNDWRFFCYRNFLEDNKFDNVFLSDGSDVIVVQDPNEIVSKYPDFDLFVCRDSLMLEEFPYIEFHERYKLENLFYFLINKNRLELINMGVIGGSYSNVMQFLNHFCTTRIKMGDPDFNADMWVGQYVFRHLLSNKKIMVGDPFTSNFKQYETNRKDVFFIHK